MQLAPAMGMTYSIALDNGSMLTDELGGNLRNIVRARRRRH
jgi:hypothetical protein